jgi:phosphoribosylformylglycinamidine synthase I
MKSAVVTFPGSNCDRDMREALGKTTGRAPLSLWHADVSLPKGLDLIALPGGFSYGDYLRCGAIASRSPLMAEIRKFALGGGYVLGVCNGFQILTEAGLLPGALMRNKGLRFVCKTVRLRVLRCDTAFASAYQGKGTVRIPVAHHDGNYVAGRETPERLQGEGRVAFAYDGDAENPNGSAFHIAGVYSENFRVLGMMPHPERAVDPETGGTDGAGVFRSLMDSVR